MFFVLSKLVWFLFSPVNFAILLAGLSALLAFTRFARVGRWLGLLAVVALGLMAFSPLPRAVIRPLEDRFPQQDAAKGPVAGIVGLGGAVLVLGFVAAIHLVAATVVSVYYVGAIMLVGGIVSLLLGLLVLVLVVLAVGPLESLGWWSDAAVAWSTATASTRSTRSNICWAENSINTDFSTRAMGGLFSRILVELPILAESPAQ